MISDGPFTPFIIPAITAISAAASAGTSIYSATKGTPTPKTPSQIAAGTETGTLRAARGLSSTMIAGRGGRSSLGTPGG